MSCRRDVQPGDGRLLEPRPRERNGVRRWKRLHADGHVPGGRVLRHQPCHVRGFGPVPRRRDMQIPRRASARTLPRPTGRAATTAMRVRKRTRARAGCAPAATRSRARLRTSATSPAPAIRRRASVRTPRPLTARVATTVTPARRPTFASRASARAETRSCVRPPISATRWERAMR